MSKAKFKFPLHDIHLKKTLGILRNACILAILAPLCLYTMHNLPEKNRYRSFYSNYDPIDSFDRMQAGGYLTSCPKESKDSKDKK